MKKLFGWLLLVTAALLLPTLVIDLSLHAAGQANNRMVGSVDELPPDPGYRSSGGRHKVTVSSPELVRQLGSKGGRLVAEYGEFALMEVDDETALTLKPGREIQFHDEYNVIELNAGRVDTTSPDVQDEKRPPASFAGKRLHLVQFVGPVKPEWYDQLLATGVQIVTYVPNNAYLVYGDRRTIRRIGSMKEQAAVVQWDGEYLDTYKIDPTIFQQDEKQNSIVAQSGDGLFGIQLIAGDKEDDGSALQLIEQLKTEPILVQWEILNYLNVVVRLPLDAVKPVAAMPGVVSIAPYIIPEKFDERQNQIIAGNLTGTSPTPGDWLAYLASHGFTQAQFDASGFVVNVSDSGIDNATTLPGHFGLYTGGVTTNPSRVIYNRLEGTAHVGSTLQGCDGHGTLNAHIIGGFVPFGFGSGFPHTDAEGFRFGMGVCPFVRVGSSVIFDPNIFTSPNLVNLESKAYNDGARISSNSWGANTGGAYNLNSQTFDAIVRDAQPASSTFPAPGNQEYVVVFAAGNAGPTAQTVGAPGTAKNVITAGASENVRSHSAANGGNNAAGTDGCGVGDTGANSSEDIIGFSSRGPCSDQRRKPEIVAPGTHVTGGVFQIASPPANGQAGPCFNGGGVCRLPGGGTLGDPDNFFPLGQQFYTSSSGTSHSTPAIAGAAALVRQHFLNEGFAAPTPAMTKASLMNTARYLTGVGANDNLWSNNQGMGELNLNSFFDVFVTPSILRDQIASDTFTATGQTRIFTGNIADTSKPFRVTLAWTDPPGPTVGNAFVNNLDLEVTVGGNTFRGNVFSGAFSATGGSADPRNNAESVFVPAGTSGTFIITIRAANIAGDGVPNIGGALDQDFALVVFNAVQATVPVVNADAAALVVEGCSPANGVIDPDETVTVNFGLRNVGTGNTTDLVATLLPTGGVTAPSGPESYGVLTAGGPPVSRAFSFTASALCGGTLTATLQLQDGASNLGTATFTFTLGALNPLSLTESYSTGGVSTPIPDLTTIESPILVSDTGVVTDVNVKIRINHTFDGDLDIFLVAPDNTTVELSTDNGGGGDNYGAGANDCTGTFTVFDDSAATLITAGVAPFAGTFRPEQPLSALNGKKVNGTWKLRITDDAGADVGTLFCWEIEISRRNFVCCGVPGDPAVVTAGSTLLAESCVPANGAPDPDETVTISFALNNAGSGDTTNLVATLLPTGGINTPSAPQTYGVVPAGGPAVSRPFTFVPTGLCGGTVIATLQLQDGATNLGTVSFNLTLGATVIATNSFSNAGSIAIPATGTSGPASPYPSTISVAGLSGNIAKVTVTLSNMNHTFPDDIDILLAGPAGQRMILMSDVGTNLDLVGVTLTLDDAAAALLPDSAQIVSGTFRPTNIGLGDAFPAPAPGPPHGATLSVFNGTNPNGVWSLFVTDDAGADIGSIAGGWTITITTNQPVCCDSPCSLQCAAAITRPNDAGVCGALVTFPLPTVTGTCGVIACVPPSGSFFPVGSTTVTCTATRADAATNTCSFTVTVNDTEAAVITGASVNKTELWPPNHKMVEVTVNYDSADNCTPAASINCTLSVASNEPVDGSGDGNTQPDWEVIDAHRVKLRAERSGSGNDRIYTITIKCTDAAGNVSTKTVTVKVPHDQGS